MSHSTPEYETTRPATSRVHRRSRARWPRRVLASALLALTLAIVAQTPALGGQNNGKWVGTWTTSQVEPGVQAVPGVPGAPFTDLTLRQIVYVSIGGDQLRVRLSNFFGEAPLTISAASVGIPAAGASVVSGTL